MGYQDRRLARLETENKRLRAAVDAAKRDARLTRAELESQRELASTWRRLAVNGGPLRRDDPSDD